MKPGRDLDEKMVEEYSGIAPTSGNHCIERAVSTMRLALGYETGLPSNWRIGERRIENFILALGQSFPDRRVLIWHDCDLGHISIPPNIDSYRVSLMPEIDWDDYLIAFVYGNGNGNSHIAIGAPVRYGGDKWPTVFVVIAIALSISALDASASEIEDRKPETDEIKEETHEART